MKKTNQSRQKLTLCKTTLKNLKELTVRTGIKTGKYASQKDC